MWRSLRRVREFLDELKRRNVYKVAVAYAAVVFIALQVAGLLVPATTLPAWSDELLIYLSIFGFPVALVLAWAFEMTPEGVRRTPGRPEEDVPEKRRVERGGERQAPDRSEPPEESRPSRARPETVRFEPPSAGTFRMLPARLEVVAGDPDVEEVRFFEPDRDRVTEFTFGRREKPSPTHVQLDCRTVSREHARITFGENGPTIENLSTTNPTRVNDRPLEGRGTSTGLEDGDVIDMGEIRFRYRAH